MEPTTSFGYWVRRRRKAQDLTQDELAQRVGCATSTIKKIEADERRPSRQLAERLVHCLDIPETERPAFLQAARAELAVDHLAAPAFPSPDAPTQKRKTRRAASPSASPPAVLKGYVVREQIGMGGFGVVYRAEQPGVGREVALKIILPEYANRPEFIRRFEAEAQRVARLEHPYIVPLYDYWRDPSGAYLVMRYIRGGTLRDALRLGPWSLDRATRLLEQLAAALAFAHRHGVVHRDLKPANVLLDADGNAYLSDFGIAKDVGVITATDETLDDALVGSPEYLTPEQITNGPITPQTDLYSLGVLLYEVLRGARPFGQLPLAEQLARQLTDPLPALERADLSHALDAVIQQATAKRPADRYPDAVSLLADWQRAVTQGDGKASRTYDLPVMEQVAITSRSGTWTAPDNDTTVTAVQLENPYKGLRAFAEADAADFFGREVLTQQLLERLAEEHPAERLLAVVGPSGSGKSSVVRAGLIPALRCGGLPGSERWFVVEAFPGAHPFEEVEAALLRIAMNPPESLLPQLREDERGLARAVKRVLPDDPEVELVLVIDQFEELWTLTESEADRMLMLDSLREAVLDPRSRLRAIITLRADFIDRPLQDVQFGELLRERMEFILPLTPEELRCAVVGPAQRVGVLVEPELIATIINDVSAQSGALPLLQYTLTELFEWRLGHVLTLDAYRATGGIAGALARRADEIYEQLDATGQAMARQLFLRLVALGEGTEDTRRRVPLTEVGMATSGDGPLATVIDRYGRYRLLTFDHDPFTRTPTLEVAHEALIRCWGRLRAWIDASREDLRVQRRLATAAAEWEAGGRDPSFLASGVRLVQFAALAQAGTLELNDREQHYLTASLAERERQAEVERARQERELTQARALAEEQQRRAEEQGQAAARLRRRAIWLMAALLLMLLATIAAGMFARQAQANYANAESQRLAAESSGVLSRGESAELAALLALRGLKAQYTPQADLALQRAAHAYYGEQIFVHPQSVFRTVFAPDGRTLLTASADGIARLWDVTTGQELRQFSGHTDLVASVAFSPDGRQVLTGSLDRTVRLWDAQTGQELRRFAHPPGIVVAAFAPDGKTILTGDQHWAIQLWDAVSGVQRMVVNPPEPQPTTAFGVFTAFSPDGRFIAVGDLDGSVRLLDAGTGQVLRTIKAHKLEIYGLAFSPDGQQLVTASFDKTAKLWDVATGTELRTFTGHTDIVFQAVFAPDGKSIFTGSLDTTGRLWDTTTGQELRRFVVHTSSVYTVAFSPDGRHVLTGSKDGTVRLWDITMPVELDTFAGQTSFMYGLVFSPNGRYLATGSVDKTAILWDVATATPRYVLHHDARVDTVAFSPDGRHAGHSRLGSDQPVGCADRARATQFWTSKCGTVGAVLVRW